MKLVPTVISAVCPACLGKGSWIHEHGTQSVVNFCDVCSKSGRIYSVALAPVGYDGKGEVEISQKGGYTVTFPGNIPNHVIAKELRRLAKDLVADEDDLRSATVNYRDHATMKFNGDELMYCNCENPKFCPYQKHLDACCWYRPQKQGRCGECKWWDSDTRSKVTPSDSGVCRNGNVPENLRYCVFQKDFGCIHFECKEVGK